MEVYIPYIAERIFAVITDDLRVQDAILVYLYKNIYDDSRAQVSRLSDVISYLRETGAAGADIEITNDLVQRQIVILQCKELLTFVTLYVSASLKLTREGCMEAERVLLRKHYDEKCRAE